MMNDWRVLTWPAGATWTFRATITNDGANSGNHIYDFSPGARSEFEVLYGSIFNGDAAGRGAQVRILNPDDDIVGDMVPNTFTLATGARMPFPATDEIADNAGVSTRRWIITGNMAVSVRVNSVAVSQDSAVGITVRIRGAIPTVTLTSPTGATETVTESGVV